MIGRGRNHNQLFSFSFFFWVEIESYRSTVVKKGAVYKVKCTDNTTLFLFNFQGHIMWLFVSVK
jgi:hypothetical protein